MTDRPRAGLLPLYLKLYDDTQPERRADFEPFLDAIVKGLEADGVEVVRAPVCRVADEFHCAVADLEAQGVDCLVTLHLAYSPSLESIEAFLQTDLPILILDTTMDPAFGPGIGADRIMFNHGIHGVMDLATMMRRRGRRFDIVAGHYAESDVLPRAADRIRAARAARRLASMRALRVGPPFAGMGDFAVEESVLKDKLGVHVDQVDAFALFDRLPGADDPAVAEEIERDRAEFDCLADEDIHVASTRVALALRALLDEGDYGAQSVNFLAFDRADGPPVPFAEISKAMARGIGYGGEGDVLTASLVGALASAFPETTFTEIFCPDWRGDRLFLSHMGEINPRVIGGRPRFTQRAFPFTPAPDPALITGPLRPGPAVYVNLAPGPNDTFALIAAPVRVIEDGSSSAMADTIRAWVQPSVPVASFLETYARLGGTHHSALVLGDRLEAIRAFARFAGIEYHEIG